MIEGARDREVHALLRSMTGKTGPLATIDEWSAVKEWESFSARFILMESGEHRVALKLGTNWDEERVVFVAEESVRVRKLLSEVSNGGVTMPEIFGVLTQPPAIAISYVEGALLFDSLRSLDEPELAKLMVRCGRAIGAYHRAQPAFAVGSPEPFSKGDLLKVARLSGVDRRRAMSMTEYLHSARRYQFSPNDLLVDHDGNVVLLDPPHFSRYDYVHRDVGTVFVEIHRNLIGSRRPDAGHSLHALDLAGDAFVSGYQEAGPVTLESPDDRLAIALFSISRVLGVAWGRLRSGNVRSGVRALGWARWIKERLPGKGDLE